MKKSLEMDLEDGRIPRLIPVDPDEQNHHNDLWAMYCHAEDYEEIMEHARTEYYKVSLDVFSQVMAKDDSRLSLLSNDYFKLSQEKKFLDFIERGFKLNENECYIDLGTFSDRKALIDFFTKQLSNCDRIDQIILLNQFDLLKESTNTIYLITDSNLLKTFFKLFLRESLWNCLYFNKVPVLIKSNYDISIPLIFRNEQDKKTYEKLAKQSDLFFL
ncbi:hypothetical protein [Candidatus Enterococcus clewellii]|uniref:Uncharacterized protein n=1 Tax=Candidatus Enterococcus clewellii TaxID=1834193 RepID=A0A242JYX4_9ENTE|nr:hypothetical protein [Enterococcus sp. 9E7_DIV0242]OTP10526.1 hypothetical protein A5888_003824 [Enterococcus sp. 9E7_DIV0242]